MATKRHPTGTCIVCDMNRLDEKKPILLCENCGKPMADHDDMARCWVRALPDHSDGSGGAE